MTLDDIKSAVLEAVKKYPISRVTLFGSRANGTAHENSDVDLIIEFNRPVTLITIAKVTQYLEELMRTSVDVIHGPVRDNDMFSIDKEIEIYAA